MTNFTLKDFAWLWYPLVAVVLIITSLNYILLQGDTWRLLKQKKDRVESQEEVAAKLRTKLEQLRAVDAAQVARDISLLESAVPTSKNALIVINQLQSAAVQSGSSLTGYRGSVGKLSEGSTGILLSTDFTVPTINQLPLLLQTLEMQLPLLEVRQGTWSEGKAKLSVEGLWSPAEAASASAQLLPENAAQNLEKIRTALGQYTNSAVSAQGQLLQTGTNPNPF